MRAPYLKKEGEVLGFKIFIVNGTNVRKNLDEEFTNFGQHYRFNFIPENEFWIDDENSSGEKRFFVEHLLVENRLMKRGFSYDRAIEIADRKEKSERIKSSKYKKIKKIKNHEKLVERIHKQKLKKYSNDKISVWIVNGELVRDLFYIDFTEGGHDKVYHFVPKNEVWIDDDLSNRDLKFVLLHELHERNLMSKGYNYDSAHKSSSKIEHTARKYPKKTLGLINLELRKSK